MDGGGGGQNILWLILIAALILILVIAALWYVLSHGEPTTATPSPAPSHSAFSWTGAWARTDGPGGGLLISGSGPAYSVTLYDGAIQPVGSVPATATPDGASLHLTLPVQFPLAGPYGALTATITADAEMGTAMMAVRGAEGGGITIGLERVPALTPITPASSSPTAAGPTAPASATPTPSATGSPTAEQALQHQMIAAVGALQAGIEAWAAHNHETYPPPAEVRRDGTVAAYVDPWPSNPWSPGQPLAPGLEPGDYVYDRLDGGLNYRLTGVLDKGTFVVP